MSQAPAAGMIDEAKLGAFMGKVVGDLGALISASLVHIGDKLGLYKAMADGTPVTSTELAQRTGTTERYVREWLVNQAAGGYIEYDPSIGRYHLLPEQAAALADSESPYFVCGGFQSMLALTRAEPRIADAFRTGEGMFWGEHDHNLFQGTERFFKPGYIAHLVGSWIPALDGVDAKLKAGAKVADVGCGHDLGNPAGSAQRARETLAADGTVMIVEPMAGNAIEENLNPVGRVFSGASVLCCTPNALAYGGHALGTIATDAALGEMVSKGGLTRFRRAAETPFNRVFEAKL
jgi:hypothetical protein